MKAELNGEVSTILTAVGRRQRGAVTPCGVRSGGVVKALQIKKRITSVIRQWAI